MQPDANVITSHGLPEYKPKYMWTCSKHRCPERIVRRLQFWINLRTSSLQASELRMTCRKISEIGIGKTRNFKHWVQCDWQADHHCTAWIPQITR